jgi:hypothetical protein
MPALEPGALASGVSGTRPEASSAPLPLLKATPKHVADRVLLAQLPSRSAAPKQPLTVTVIDEFERKNQNVDAHDLVPDLAHGELIGRQIERGWPTDASKVQVRRVQSKAEQLNEVVVATVKSITRESAARQGVDPGRADLSHEAINLSAAWTPGSAQDNKALIAALQAFTRQGGRVYIAAGNDFKNDLQNHLQGPGIVYVDGSDGAVGGKPNPQPSARYDNGGGAQCVANAKVAPRTLGDGSIDVNQDGQPDVDASELAPTPHSAWMGQPVADAALIEGDELASLVFEYMEQLVRIEAQASEMAKTSSAEATGRWADAQADAASDAKTQGLNGHLVTLDAFQQAAAKYLTESQSSSLALTGVDPAKVYVDAKAAWLGLMNGDLSTVVFHAAGPDGRLSPLSAPASGAPIYGTSFATPQCLIDREQPGSR